MIQHSSYTSDEELIESRIRVMNGLNILSLHCQSLHAKFDYIKLLTEKFMSKKCPLQDIYAYKRHGLLPILIYLFMRCRGTMVSHRGHNCISSALTILDSALTS